MKICVIYIFAALFLVMAPLQARTEVAVGLHMGAPYFDHTPSYFVDEISPRWLDEPAEIILVRGRPHRMHMWRGRWYDEEWLPARSTVVIKESQPRVIYPDWYYTPVTEVTVEGRLHRMHYYEGMWYDEMDLRPTVVEDVKTVVVPDSTVRIIEVPPPPVRPRSEVFWNSRHRRW